MTTPKVELSFDAGTVLARVSSAGDSYRLPEPWTFDSRVDRWRIPAVYYREAYMALHAEEEEGRIDISDTARAYEELSLTRVGDRSPRPYQREAVKAWLDADQRGQIILPTGSGKSFVAHLIMEQIQRSTLIVVPTIDLMNQWYSTTLSTFDLDEVGLIGGGHHDVRAVTVTTYDSAFIHMERYGNRFGLVIFDECHHLPGPSYSQAARCMLAPFRLGLTATPEREDGGEVTNDELVGPIVYRRKIRELSGDFLSQYETETIRVELTEKERQRYEHARSVYLDFLRSNRINFGRKSGWGEFVARSSRSREGRRAMRAYQAQRSLALSCDRKIRAVERILLEHRKDRTILFTHDNDTVYQLSRRLLIPCITHQTPTRERKEILDCFNDGTYRAVVTSRVLNEGVDVPEANVAVILSGTSTVREHVQRLGRILRPREGKQAMLYEVIAADTVEEKVSERRRKHDAYR
jgi:superfamily II DNA or RNA helicase